MRAHARVASSLGGPEEFKRVVTNRFPVAMSDNEVVALAKEFGWEDSFMEPPKTTRKRARNANRPDDVVTNQSGDIGQLLAMLQQQGSSSVQAAAGESSQAANQSDNVPVPFHEQQETMPPAPVPVIVPHRFARAAPATPAVPATPMPAAVPGTPLPVPATPVPSRFIRFDQHQMVLATPPTVPTPLAPNAASKSRPRPPLRVDVPALGGGDDEDPPS